MNYVQTEIADILDMMPYREPFRFIDDITYADEDRIEGYYHFDPDSPFYQGHFPDYPLTPGVILIEVMAQIGLVALGIHIMQKNPDLCHLLNNCMPVFAAANVNFKKQVLPNETVYVISEKVYFRHKKLVCNVRLLNSRNLTVAEGTISGFIVNKP